MVFVIGADIICQESDSYACAATLRSILKPNGGRAYIICGTSKHRFGIDAFPKAIEQDSTTTSHDENDTPSSTLHLLSMYTFQPLTTDITSIVPIEQPKVDSINIHNSKGNDNLFDLQNDLEQTAGFVPNMELTMFVIERR